MPISTDGYVSVMAEELCPLCGCPIIDEDRPVILIESGQIESMRKDPNFRIFIPDIDNGLENEECAVIDVYHAECIVELAQWNAWGRYGPHQCDVCEQIFLEEIPRWAFRLRIGMIDYESGIFDPDNDTRATAYLCPGCLEVQLGKEGLLKTA